MAAVLGHVELGETMKEGALRECKEEAGVDIELKGLMRFQYYTSPKGVGVPLALLGAIRSIYHYFDNNLMLWSTVSVKMLSSTRCRRIPTSRQNLCLTMRAVVPSGRPSRRSRQR